MHVLNLIWFGYITRLSQWEGGGVISSFKLFLPAFATRRGREGGGHHPVGQLRIIPTPPPPPPLEYYLTGAVGLWWGLDELAAETGRRGAASRWQEHTGGARPTASRPSHPTGGTKEKFPHLRMTTFLWQNMILFSVLRIRDVYPGSRILIFTRPRSRILEPGSNKSTKRGDKFFTVTNIIKL
jgi:hypothetical protein